MKILAIEGSPRKRGNSSILLQQFLDGALEGEFDAVVYKADDVNIKPCRGCLKCNVYGECVIKGDDWPRLSGDILDSDVIVFASPVYFHHLPGTVKIILDRFRSFIEVKVKSDGLAHTPRHRWEKRFVLLLTLGSPLSEDADPVIDLFSFVTGVMGSGNSLEVLAATGLQLSGQIKMSRERLVDYYSRIGLDEKVASEQYEINQSNLNRAFDMGLRRS